MDRRNPLGGSMSGLNAKKKTILRAWSMHLSDFAKREWFSIFVWSGLGVIVSGLIHLTLWDHAFQGFLSSWYIPTAKLFDDPRLYFPYLLTAAAAVFLAIILRVPA